jgi:valyl-tRNA synthetase
VSRWPSPPETWHNEPALVAGRGLIDVTEEVRRWKGERQLSVGTPVESVRVECDPELAAALSSAIRDLQSVTRAAHIEIVPIDGLQAVQVTVEAAHDRVA